MSSTEKSAAAVNHSGQTVGFGVRNGSYSLEKKIQVDSPVKAVFEVVALRFERRPTTPAPTRTATTTQRPAASNLEPQRHGARHGTERNAPPTRPVEVAEGTVARLVATQLHKRRSCIGCGATSHGTVWGLEVCAGCGERINAIAPSGVTSGLGYVIAVCAFVQGLRTWPTPRAA